MFDLRDKLTVFIITTGAPTFEDCLAAIQAQDLCNFQIKVIRNISPMSAAFQQMNLRCTTPFFIQVDEDMILYPDAIFKLYSALMASPENTALYYLSLLDTDLGIPIVGVKIYRHSIISKYPWVDSFSCEMDQLARLQKDGYTYGGKYKEQMGYHVVGEHRSDGSEELLFERYLRLSQKMRLVPGNEGWARWPGKFLDRVLRSPIRSHWFALFGWLAGITSDPEQTERDFRKKCDTYARLAEYFDDLPIGEHQPVVTHPPTPIGVAVQPRPILKSNIQRDALRPPDPTGVNVYVTSKCNLFCSFCGRQKGQKPDAPDVTVELLQTALDRWPSLRGVCLAGFGEPLLSPHLPGLIEACLRDGKYISLITNGVALTDLPAATWEPLSMLNQVSVSLNAASEEDHAQAAGIVGAYGKVIDGIAMLKEHSIEPTVSFVISYPKLPRIEAYLDLAQLLGCRVDLLSVLPHFGNAEPPDSYWREALLVGQAEVAAILEDAAAHPWAAHVRTWPTLMDRERCPWSCDSARVSVGIDGDGNLTPCRRILGPSPSFGHIGDKDAWVGGGCGIWREEMTARKTLPCQGCFGNWK